MILKVNRCSPAWHPGFPRGFSAFWRVISKPTEKKKRTVLRVDGIDNRFFTTGEYLLFQLEGALVLFSVKM